jgi:hypothetical protein
LPSVKKRKTTYPHANRKADTSATIQNGTWITGLTVESSVFIYYQPRSQGQNGDRPEYLQQMNPAPIWQGQLRASVLFIFG